MIEITLDQDFYNDLEQIIRNQNKQLIKIICVQMQWNYNEINTFVDKLLEN